MTEKERQEKRDTDRQTNRKRERQRERETADNGLNIWKLNFPGLWRWEGFYYKSPCIQCLSYIDIIYKYNKCWDFNVIEWNNGYYAFVEMGKKIM